jgi:hypothetical protein
MLRRSSYHPKKENDVVSGQRRAGFTPQFSQKSRIADRRDQGRSVGASGGGTLFCLLRPTVISVRTDYWEIR